MFVSANAGICEARLQLGSCVEKTLELPPDAEAVDMSAIATDFGSAVAVLAEHILVHPSGQAGICEISKTAGLGDKSKDGGTAISVRHVRRASAARKPQKPRNLANLASKKTRTRSCFCKQLLLAASGSSSPPCRRWARAPSWA